KKAKRKDGFRPNVVHIRKRSPNDIHTRIQREVTRLKSDGRVTVPLSREDTIESFAEVLELNTIYMDDMRDPKLESLIESNVRIIAKIQFFTSRR
ncbi:MAG: hypothetical protein ABW119_22585, partial [Candidatus Thiodiazotropha lotti]